MIIRATVEAIVDDENHTCLILVPHTMINPTFKLPTLNAQNSGDMQLQIPVDRNSTLLSMLPGAIVELSIKPARKIKFKKENKKK